MRADELLDVCSVRTGEGVAGSVASMDTSFWGSHFCWGRRTAQPPSRHDFLYSLQRDTPARLLSSFLGGTASKKLDLFSVCFGPVNCSPYKLVTGIGVSSKWSSGPCGERGP